MQRSLQWTNEPVNTLGFVLYHKDLEQNLEEIMLKTRTIANMWAYRNLTLIGKTLIINSLLSSLFVYRMQLLHTISEDKFIEFDKIVEDFMWVGKKPKIPLWILQQPKDQGGLGLTNLRIKHLSLLSKWIYMSRNDDRMACLARTVLNIQDLDLLIYANLNKADCDKLLPIGKFWHSAFNKWCRLNYHEPQNKEKVLNQQLWLNSSLKIGNNILYNEMAIENGLLYVGDIIDITTLNFKSYSQICEEFGNAVTWLEYNGMKSAFPDYWKFLIKHDHLIDDDEVYSEHIDCKNITRYVYH